jgi:hypothetical protein
MARVAVAPRERTRVVRSRRLRPGAAPPCESSGCLRLPPRAMMRSCDAFKPELVLGRSSAAGASSSTQDMDAQFSRAM